MGTVGWGIREVQFKTFGRPKTIDLRQRKEETFSKFIGLINLLTLAMTRDLDEHFETPQEQRVSPPPPPALSAPFSSPSFFSFFLL